jgi:branched-chain amino acid transport system substrate-binding protein
MVNRLRGAVVILSTVALAVALAGCGNAKVTAPTAAPNGDLPTGGPAPGVTKTAITVGSLSTLSGPLAEGFGEIVDGVQAYFDMVNANGGVNGRKIDLKYQEDDGGSSTNDTTQARNLVEQDNVFAVVGVGSVVFSGSTFLAQQDTPTFGYQVTDDWNNYPNLFAAYGSYLDYLTEEPTAANIAKRLNAKSVAVLAYSFGPSSAPCQDIVTGLKHYGFNVSFQDLAYGLGGNPTADVEQMKQKHVDLLFSCMEGSDNLALSQSLQQYGVTNTHFVWLNGYSQQTIKANPTTMNGVIFGEQHVPYEAATDFPGKYPGLSLYLKEMKKYEPQWVYDDTAIQGWICAAQFVAGLKAIGKSVTQTRLIAAINNMTNFNAGGLVPPINWKTAHDSAPPPYCGAYVEDQDGTTHVIFNTGKSVFTCVGNTSDSNVAAPAGTPGA